jgi:hypothetical protein
MVQATASAQALFQHWQTIQFPGRLRFFAEGDLSVHDGDLDWPEAEPGHVLAAAVGAAWAEKPRRGAVVAFVREDTLNASGAALELARRLQVTNLVIVAAGGLHDDSRQALTARGWAVDDALAAKTLPTKPTVLILGKIDTQPFLKERQRGTDSSLRKGCVSIFSARLRREWQPVHLPAAVDFARHVRPGATFDAIADGLRAYAHVEKRLLLPQDAAGWSDAPETQEKLIAAAQVASEGFRVVWRMPSNTSAENRLLSWSSALTEIGRRGLALKILCADAHAPPLCVWPAFAGWWIAGPADAAETASVIAHTLDTEDAMVVSVPTHADSRLPGAPAAFEPGSGRWLAPMGTVNCVCDQRGISTALDARESLSVIGIEMGIFFCASLSPLPLFEIERAAQHGPLVVTDAGESRSGLGAAVMAALPQKSHPITCVGDGATAGDLAQAVRAMMAG